MNNSIIRRFLTTLLLAGSLPGNASLTQSNHPDSVKLRSGLVITNSVTVTPGTYRLVSPPSPDSAVITLRGDNITVDFSGATLLGSDENANPDLFSGTAIRVEGGKNIRILHAIIHGYKVAILARGTKNLELTDNDVSYNWKPRLFSLIEHESLVDWLSYHHNENEEWLRYGAGIYLTSVSEGVLRNNRCSQGMNALLLTRCDHLRITDNTFSFNSGLGIGLYRSVDNTIMHNRLDYNVRGYSHRFYHRGQDSADILVFEQSSGNVFAYNSATHGGDGFFLWAGQTTMDSGSGGANDNLLYGNDFSYSPANGIEATFSRNTFIANRLVGNDYGVWGGYSFESKIVGNNFSANRVGIAVEHGQDNVVLANRFEGDTTAINLWAVPIEPSDWGYPKHRDTKSRDYTIEHNLVTSARYGVKAANTNNIRILDNRWGKVDTTFNFRDTSNVRTDGNIVLGSSDGHGAPEIPPEYLRLAPKPDAGSGKIPESLLAGLDRSAIIVDEWGPYDYLSPKLWPVDSPHTLPLRLRTLGPPGKWSVVNERGIGSLSRRSGEIGDTISIMPKKDSEGIWELTLEYRGDGTISPHGEHRDGGQPYRFTYEHFEPPVNWNIRFFAWTDSTDPRSRNKEFNGLLQATPIVRRQSARLDYEWYRPAIRELPQERFAFEATGTVEIGAGTYSLRTISDDGVRVWVDGALVIDNWSQHGSAIDYAPLSAGKHDLRVQYFQVDGWVEFRLDILRGSERSKGSPE